MITFPWLSTRGKKKKYSREIDWEKEVTFTFTNVVDFYYLQQNLLFYLFVLWNSLPG